MAVVLAVLFAGVAYSSEKPNLKTTERQNNSNAEQRGSDTSTITVKILPAPDADSKAAQEEKHRNEKSIQDEKLADATVWLARITAALAVFTGLLWLATYRLARDAKRTAERQATEMKESLKISGLAASAMDKVAENIAATASQQMRAYCTVVISSALYQEMGKGLRFEAKPRIVNTGHTPAHKVCYKARAAILPHKLPDDFTFPLPDIFIGGAVLGPQQVFDIGAVVEGPFVLDADVEDIKHGSSGNVLHIWGIITYTDVFGESRETKFCQNIMWIGESEKEIVYGYYNARHNEAT